jgi:hypothetical protein
MMSCKIAHATKGSYTYSSQMISDLRDHIARKYDWKTDTLCPVAVSTIKSDNKLSIIKLIPHKWLKIKNYKPSSFKIAFFVSSEDDYEYEEE